MRFVKTQISIKRENFAKCKWKCRVVDITLVMVKYNTWLNNFGEIEAVLTPSHHILN